MPTIRELITLIKFQLTGAAEAQQAIAGIKRELASLKDTVINVRIRRTEEGGSERRSNGRAPASGRLPSGSVFSDEAVAERLRIRAQAEKSVDAERETANQRRSWRDPGPELENRVRSTSGAMADMAARTEDAGRRLTEVGEKGAEAGSRVREGMQHANEGVMRLRETIVGFVETLAIGVGVHEFVEMTNDWAAMSATIKIATASQEEFIASRQRIVDISRQNRVGFEGTSQLFANFKAAQRDTKESNEQILSNVDTISKALAIGHQSNARNMAATRQFDDFLMLGKIQQRHLNSLKIDSPTLARAMEEAVGGPQELEKFMKGPQNNLKGIVELLAKMKPLVDKNFKDLPLTFGNAMQRIRDDLEETFGKIFVDTGAISDFLQPIVAVFDWIADSTDAAAKALGGYKNLAFVVMDAVLAFLSVAIARTAVWAAELAIAELPWLLMAAAIAAVGIAIQDVWVWMHGGESITGRILGNFQEWKPTIDGIRASVADVWNTLTSYPWKAQLASIGISWSSLKQFVLDVGSAIGESINQVRSFFGLMGQVNTAGKDRSLKGWLDDNFSELKTIIGWLETIDGYMNKINGYATGAGKWVHSLLTGSGAAGADASGNLIPLSRLTNPHFSAAGGIAAMSPSALAPSNSTVNTHAPSMTVNTTVNATTPDPASVATAANRGVQQGVRTSLGGASGGSGWNFWAPGAEASVAQ